MVVQHKNRFHYGKNGNVNNVNFTKKEDPAFHNAEKYNVKVAAYHSIDDNIHP